MSGTMDCCEEMACPMSPTGSEVPGSFMPMVTSFKYLGKASGQRETESAWQAKSSQPGCGVSARIEMEVKGTLYTDSSSQLAMRSFNSPKWR